MANDLRRLVASKLTAAVLRAYYEQHPKALVPTEQVTQAYADILAGIEASSHAFGGPAHGADVTEIAGELTAAALWRQRPSPLGRAKGDSLGEMVEEVLKSFEAIGSELQKGGSAPRVQWI